MPGDLAEGGCFRVVVFLAKKLTNSLFLVIPLACFDCRAELLYCGSLLKTDDILQNKGVSDGSMIHVIQKRREKDPSTEQQQQQPQPEDRELTEAEVQEVLSVWRTVDSSNFQKARQPEFMKNVLDAYPAIRRNLFVLSLLKDPILLSSMQS